MKHVDCKAAVTGCFTFVQIMAYVRENITNVNVVVIT